MSDKMEVAEQTVVDDGKIICHIDGERVHSVQLHINNKYATTWTIERYKAEFPDAPLLSEHARVVIQRKQVQAEEERRAKASAHPGLQANLSENETSPVSATQLVVSKKALHELFELGNAAAAKSSTGSPIAVSVMSGHDDTAVSYLPVVDYNYVFNIDLLKKVLLGFELNMPVLLWGYHGTGKTTVLQQIAARTKRPFVRVQHTINMQESEILGQWTVRNGATIFQLGPLPLAMLNGWVYCADEYDFAMPSVTSVYQPVLEGQSLLIKDAPPHFRKIVPHENFRFCATGNTNGTGDETGLYQGTLMQNAANYSRFAITEEVKYMDVTTEKNILVSRTGIGGGDAAKLVKLANDVRGLFAEGKIGATISPREMINAAKIGIAFGGNFRLGLELAFSNRLSRVDGKVVSEYMQRIFA